MFYTIHSYVLSRPCLSFISL